MGILSSHVPSIEQLRPGPIEIIEENGQTKKFFRTFIRLREDNRGWLLPFRAILYVRAYH